MPMLTGLCAEHTAPRGRLIQQFCTSGSGNDRRGARTTLIGNLSPLRLSSTCSLLYIYIIAEVLSRHAVSVCLSVCLPLPLSLCLSVCLSNRPPLSHSVCPSVSVPLSLCLCLSVSVCLSLSVCLSVCLSEAALNCVLTKLRCVVHSEVGWKESGVGVGWGGVGVGGLGL